MGIFKTGGKRGCKTLVVENESLGGQTQADFSEQARLSQGTGSVAQETGRDCCNVVHVVDMVGGLVEGS